MNRSMLSLGNRWRLDEFSQRHILKPGHPVCLPLPSLFAFTKRHDSMIFGPFRHRVMSYTNLFLQATQPQLSYFSNTNQTKMNGITSLPNQVHSGLMFSDGICANTLLKKIKWQLLLPKASSRRLLVLGDRVLIQFLRRNAEPPAKWLLCKWKFYLWIERGH